MPDTTDHSYAFYARWIIITFTKTFENNSRQDDLIKKLTSSEELSGLFNLAIHFLKQLKKKKGFIVNVEETRKLYARNSSSSSAFISDCIEINPQGFEEKEEIWTVYQDYCIKTSSLIDTDKKFWSDLKNNFKHQIEERRGSALEGERKRIIQGINIKDLNEVYKTLDISDKDQRFSVVDQDVLDFFPLYQTKNINILNRKKKADMLDISGCFYLLNPNGFFHGKCFVCGSSANQITAFSESESEKLFFCEKCLIF